MISVIWMISIGGGKPGMISWDESLKLYVEP